MTKYFSDRPAEIDALGRSQFASHLAKALLSVSTDHGLVVGIEGEWGSGKSSIIGFVKKALSDFGDTASHPVLVDFNPWMVSNTGALVDALVTQIAASINLNSRSPEKALKAGEKLLAYMGLLKHLKHLRYLKYVPGVSAIGNITEDVAGFAEGTAQHVAEAREALEDSKKLISTLDLAKRKAEVVEALHELECPIVVIVDDVDRLPAEEIRSVVQAIKAVADFPRTTYLLAYDRNVVADALGNGVASAGLAYLEKIVQVAYPIPPLFEYQLRDFVTKQMKMLLSTLQIELLEFEAKNYDKAIWLLTKLARHPRDVVRLMNRLMLSLPSARNEVNATDVIVFEALSQRFPQIRENVHRHPMAFTGHAFRGDAEFDEDEFDWASWMALDEQKDKDEPSWAIYMPEEEPDKTIATKACIYLFSQKSESRVYVPEDELRLADPDRLARYFRMMSLENVPEVSTIHELLRNSTGLEQALSNDDQTELIFLLEWIDNYLPSCAMPDVVGSCRVIAERSCELQATSKLTRDLADAFSKVLVRLIRKSALNLQNHCFTLTMDANLSVAEKVLLKAAAEQGKWVIRPEMVKAMDFQLVSDSDVVDNAIARWSARVRQAAKQGTLPSEPHLHSILYRFAQLNFAYQETYDLIKQICSSEEGLSRFLSNFKENNIFDAIDSYVLIEDAHAFAESISTSIWQNEYGWLARHITEPGRASAIDEQAARLLELKPPGNSSQINGTEKNST